MKPNVWLYVVGTLLVLLFTLIEPPLAESINLASAPGKISVATKVLQPTPGLLTSLGR
jgi:hypothetical protein